MTTAVFDRLVLDRDAEVKPYLSITGATWDWFLDILIDAGKHYADDYLNNPFEDDDGTPLAIPADIKLGVLRFIKLEWDGRTHAADVISRKAGDVAERYSGAVSGGPAHNVAVLDLWKRHRFTPL